MSETTQKSAIEETTIIDTDVHLNTSIDRYDIAEYLDESESRLFTNPDYSPFPSSGWDRTMNKIDYETIDGPEELEETLMGEFYVDHPILNSVSSLTRLPRHDVAIPAMRAVNDILIEEYLDANDDLYGLASIATQEPDKAAEELDRLGDEDQIVGVYVCSTGPREPLGDPFYDPIYQAAQDNDLAITFHGSAGAFMFDFPKQNQGFRQFLSVHTLAHPWSQMETVTSLIVQGTPEKFPDLDFAFLEAGIGWVPYLMFRLNGEYAKRRSEAPLLKKSPEEYIRDQFYFASQPVGEPNDPEMMQNTIANIGADSLLFATDYPHWDFDHPEAFDQHLRETFDPEDRERILGGNAADVFNISI
jgi:predicted TIM-barrel fold metal-dependent hydrolase